MWSLKMCHIIHIMMMWILYLGFQKISERFSVPILGIYFYWYKAVNLSLLSLSTSVYICILILPLNIQRFTVELTPKLMYLTKEYIFWRHTLTEKSFRNHFLVTNGYVNWYTFYIESTTYIKFTYVQPFQLKMLY